MRKLKCCILMTVMILLVIAGLSAFVLVKAALWLYLFYHMNETNGVVWWRFGFDWNEGMVDQSFLCLPTSLRRRRSACSI